MVNLYMNVNMQWSEAKKGLIGEGDYYGEYDKIY